MSKDQKQYSQFNDVDKCDNDNDSHYIQGNQTQNQPEDKNMMSKIKEKIVESSNVLAQNIINMKSSNKSKKDFNNQQLVMDNNTFNQLVKQKDTYQKKINEIKVSINSLLDQNAQNGLATCRQSLNAWILYQIKLKLLEQKNLYWCSLQEYIADEQTPLWITSLVNRCVEQIFEDILMKKTQVDKPTEDQGKKGQYQDLTFLERAKGSFLYTIMPYNKNIWQQLKNKFYIVYLLSCVLPYFTQFFVLVTQFAFINRKDEFQLLRFILDCKKFQFVSYGIIWPILSFYSLTTSWQEDNSDTMAGTFLMNSFLETISFITLFSLTTYCLIQLICLYKKSQGTISSQQGINQLQQPYQLVDTQQKQSLDQINLDISNTEKQLSSSPTRQKNQEKSKFFGWDQSGGVFSWIVIIDIFVFFMIFSFYAFRQSNSDDNQNLRYLLMYKQIYGLFCIGFFIFSFRPLYKTVMISKETGYDINGQSQPIQIAYSFQTLNKIKSMKTQEIDFLDLLQKNEEQHIPLQTNQIPTQVSTEQQNLLNLEPNQQKTQNKEEVQLLE